MMNDEKVKTEDQKDLAAFEDRATEPLISYEALLEELELQRNV